VLSRLGHIADRYFITLTFILLGWINAQSWPYLLVFIALGLAIDIRFVQPGTIIPFELLTADEIAIAKARWKKLIPLVIGLPSACVILLVTLHTLEAESPELLHSIGPTVYVVASPWIALLRHHYQDLMSHSLLDRANVVAVTYAGLFLLFYPALGFWMAKVRSIGAFDHPRTVVSTKQKLMAIPLLIMFPFLMWFAIHIITGVDIDYFDESFRRRHINTNVAKYDSFFWDMAFMQAALSIMFPLAHMILRSTLIKFHLMNANPSERSMQ